jgi:hypothetical protein
MPHIGQGSNLIRILLILTHFHSEWKTTNGHKYTRIRITCGVLVLLFDDYHLVSTADFAIHAFDLKIRVHARRLVVPVLVPVFPQLGEGLRFGKKGRRARDHRGFTGVHRFLKAASQGLHPADFSDAPDVTERRLGAGRTARCEQATARGRLRLFAQNHWSQSRRIPSAMAFRSELLLDSALEGREAYYCVCLVSKGISFQPVSGRFLSAKLKTKPWKLVTMAD